MRQNQIDSEDALCGSAEQTSRETSNTGDIKGDRKEIS